MSPRLRRIYLELAEHDIALAWKPGAELVHVDAMSRNPVDPAEEMGPDPIDQQHQRMQDTINLIEEGDDEDDHPDNIQVQVNDPLYSGLFKAAAAHQGYQQAIKHRLDGDNFDWKELPTGAYTKQLENSMASPPRCREQSTTKVICLRGHKILSPTRCN